MTFTYDQPLMLQSGPQELKIAKATRGTATVELEDGRVLVLTITVDSVRQNPNSDDAIDINHSITVEVMTKPEFPIAEAPSALQ